MISDLFRGRGKALIGGALGLAMAAAVGCSASVSPTTPVAVPTVSPPPISVTVSPLPPAGAPATMTEAKVTLMNGTVTLEKSTVDAGQIRFMVTNEGTVVHAFEIRSQGVEILGQAAIDQKTSDLQPGESAVLDVTLTPGEYEAYCPVSGHRERGMTTTLTVK